jgi:bifunctional non-homologous end joining protein LigD
MQAEKVSLYIKEGSADKEYHCHLEQKGGGWVVYGQNARVGDPLKMQPKIVDPVPYDEAKKAYDSLVKAKRKKGYTENEGGAAYQGAEVDGQVHTGISPQLLNYVSDERALELLKDDDWVMQEKDDGHRRMVAIQDDNTAVGIKRLGFAVPLPLAVVTDLASLPARSTVDGEAMRNGKYSAFDMMKFDGKDLHAVPFVERHAILGQAVKNTDNVRVSPLFVGTQAKTQAYYEIKARDGEGVVFRLRRAGYKPGRPSSGGDVVKSVFYATSTFVVEKVAKGKRSVHLSLVDEKGNKVDMGKVTIPANFDIPPIGAMVDVRYLYAYRNGALHISTYLGIRDDILVSDCTTAQLKYQPEDLEDGEADDAAELQAA